MLNSALCLQSFSFPLLGLLSPPALSDINGLRGGELCWGETEICLRSSCQGSNGSYIKKSWFLSLNCSISILWKLSGKSGSSAHGPDQVNNHMFLKCHYADMFKELSANSLPAKEEQMLALDTEQSFVTRSQH